MCSSAWKLFECKRTQPNKRPIFLSTLINQWSNESSTFLLKPTIPYQSTFESLAWGYEAWWFCLLCSLITSFSLSHILCLTLNMKKWIGLLFPEHVDWLWVIWLECFAQIMSIALIPQIFFLKLQFQQQIRYFDMKSFDWNFVTLVL